MHQSRSNRHRYNRTRRLRLKGSPVVGTVIAVAMLVAGPLTTSAENLRGFLPKVEDRTVAGVFANPATYWYTEQDMPPAYQTDSMVDGLATFHDPRYDLSGGADQKHGNGNGNTEFPWASPGGTDRANVESIRAMLLPAVDGRTLPVVAYNEVVRTKIGPNYQVRRLSWRFPVGTVFVEVLFIRDERRQPWPFTVRMRQRGDDYWDVAVFRPVPTRDDLAEEFTFEPKYVQPGRVRAVHPNAVAFDEEAVWDVLPLLQPDDVRRLLSRPFVDCTGVDWSEAVEPTSVQRFSLVPANYDGTLAGNEPTACANCHEHVAKHVSEFDRARDWYGFIRGSDGIFSFQPVDQSSVAGNGNPLPIRLRSDLTRAGLITFDPSAIGTRYYQALEGNR